MNLAPPVGVCSSRGPPTLSCLLRRTLASLNRHARCGVSLPQPAKEEPVCDNTCRTEMRWRRQLNPSARQNISDDDDNDNASGNGAINVNATFTLVGKGRCRDKDGKQPFRLSTGGSSDMNWCKNSCAEMPGCVAFTAAIGGSVDAALCEVHGSGLKRSRFQDGEDRYGIPGDFGTDNITTVAASKWYACYRRDTPGQEPLPVPGDTRCPIKFDGTSIGTVPGEQPPASEVCLWNELWSTTTLTTTTHTTPSPKKGRNSTFWLVGKGYCTDADGNRPHHRYAKLSSAGYRRTTQFPCVPCYGQTVAQRLGRAPVSTCVWSFWLLVDGATTPALGAVTRPVQHRAPTLGRTPAGVAINCMLVGGAWQ